MKTPLFFKRTAGNNFYHTLTGAQRSQLIAQAFANGKWRIAIHFPGESPVLVAEGQTKPTRGPNHFSLLACRETLSHILTKKALP